jgi:uncharacterized zinc-type alcohol dehydrogenase-like protein
MIAVQSFAAHAAGSPLAPWAFERRDVGPDDVLIDIAYCGVCHSDLHQVKNEWGGSTFPMVPGHEIVGHVTQVGSNVDKFKVGDRAGVGCFVDSCRVCVNCKANLEQYCVEGMTQTYNDTERDKVTRTFGGYSTKIVVDQKYTLKLPDNLDLAAVAPLLCAGITTWSPLRHWNIGKGHKVGVVGLGGLGHMGVKFAAAFGAETWVLTTSPGKTEDAKRLGATGTIVSKDEADMAAHASSFDFLLSTISAPYDLNAYVALLKTDGTMVTVGAPERPLDLHLFSVILGRKSVAGSMIGGIKETQEMLDYCGQHGIGSDVEIIPMQKINEAYERMLKSDVRYRFSIDIKSLAA